MSINTIRGARSWNQRFLSNSLSTWALMLMTWATLLSKEIQRPVFSILGKKNERTMTIAWIKRKILKEIARRHSMGWEAGKSLIQKCQWWKIRTCNEICEVNIKQEDWNYITCREMGGLPIMLSEISSTWVNTFSLTCGTHTMKAEKGLSGERRLRKRKWEGNEG